MLTATLFLFLLGLGSSVILAIASKIFAVEEDPKVLAITDTLPGANCGGCGYAGCSAAAEAIAAGKAPPNLCVVGGFDVAVAVAALMGETVSEKEPELASTSCTYGVQDADLIYDYNGAQDCRAAVMLYGGSKECPIGCIGLGSCVKACQFGAVHIGDDNLPIFNPKACVACGACVEACPRDIIVLTSQTRRIVGERVSTECTAPCERSCPTGIDIPSYIAAVREGRYEDGLRIIKEKCPLPLICGRICPAPCELACRRNMVDEAVGINPLKRFLADYEMKTGNYVQPYKCPASGHRTAVIGGGTEGLTLSYYLARLGHAPTIFEAKSELGGILRYVISEDRLPRPVLDHEIRGILEMGVQAETGQALGKDFTLASLFDRGFDMIALTAGGHDSRKILHPGGQASGALSGLMLMLDFRARIARSEIPELGRRVTIVDGGATALSVARDCLEMGAERVTITSRLPLDRLPEDFADAEALASLGITIRPSTVVAALGGIGDRLSCLALEAVTPQASDLPRHELLDTDSLILTAGRLPELVFARLDEESKEPANGAETRWQTVESHRTLPGGGNNGVFSSPEPGRLSDSQAVVKSILSGRRVARGIQMHVANQPILPVDHLAIESDDIPDVTEVLGVTPVNREALALPASETGAKNIWISTTEIPGLDEAAAKREAERCLSCGLTCYKRAV